MLFLALINQLHPKVFDDILALALDPDPVIRLRSQSVAPPGCESYVITYQKLLKPREVQVKVGQQVISFVNGAIKPDVQARNISTSVNENQVDGTCMTL